jgi:hypothetical protein
LPIRDIERNPSRKVGSAGVNWLLAFALIAGSGFVAYRFGGDTLRLRSVLGGAGNGSGPPRRLYSPSKIKTECLCVKSFEDASALTEVSHGSDAEAGLLLNGRAMWMQRGTDITPFDTDKDVTTVLVKSGTHSGERCHLLAKFLE